MLRKHLAVLGSTLVLLALFAAPAAAETPPHMDVHAQLSCNEYSLQVYTEYLNPGQTYDISYTLTLTPTAGGAPITVSGGKILLQ